MKFETKPTTIEAVQLTGTAQNLQDVWDYLNSKGAPPNALYFEDFCREYRETDSITLRTANGEMEAYKTDYIISLSPDDTYACPLDVFMSKYRPVTEPPSGLTIGQAVAALKKGKLVGRAGWNGKKMFLYLVPGSTFEVNRPPLSNILEPGTEVNYLGHVDMKTADGSCVPWLCSQTDLLAEDWEIVDGSVG